MAERRFFLVTPETIQDSRFTLDKKESHHLVHVIRSREGDEIWLMDGVGTAYRARWDHCEKDCVSGRILKSYPGYGESQVEIHLGLAILKRSRFEWAVEKATELGVRKIWPLNLDRSRLGSLNMDRLRSITLTAAKQCARSMIPEVTRPESLETWLGTVSSSDVCACHGDGSISMTQWLRENLNLVEPIYILIGPEGDFSPREMEILRATGVHQVNLGQRRLRSETAAVTAMAIVREILRDRN